MSADNEKEKQEKITELLHSIVQHDAHLREKYKIKDKFRFVTDELQKLLKEAESELASNLEKQKTKSPAYDVQGVTIYVYLFNAKGTVLESWQSLLVPKLFYEYSINRPIYADKKLVEALIRTKEKKMQHGYLTIKIKPDNILPEDPKKPQKDSLGQPLLKIKEGSLNFNQLICFTCNEKDYTLASNGALIKTI